MLTSLESDDAARRKAFSISADGRVQPACPGCLNHPPQQLFAHDCPDAGAPFVTAYDVCPICDKSLTPPISFPSKVADVMKNPNGSSKEARFDPASNALLPSPGGKFLVILSGHGSRLPIVVPRQSRISTKQEYFDSWYELFDCDNPVSGEITILSPAVVEAAEEGWKLREVGRIEIKPDPSAQPPVSTARVQIPCAACGVLGDVGHAYCKRCGSPMLGQQSVAAVPPESRSEVEEDSAHSLDTTTDQFYENVSRASEELSVPGGSAPAGIPWKGLLAGIAALGLVGIVIVITALSGKGLLPGSELSVEKKLDRSIAAGNLFGPGNDNAHDLYYTLKNSGVSDETLRGYREKLTPLLTSHGYQLISGLMQIGYDEPDFTEWQEASKSLDWVQELNPNNTFIAARAAYCRGRAAYLQNDLDGALKWWTSAADLDKSWVLPVNGLGMVHTGKRNFATARSYFLQALQRDAKWPFPDENIGNTYVSEKNYSTAKEFYQKAVGKAPDWAKPHVHLAYIALMEKDYATAVAEFETALGPKAVGLKGDETANTQKALEKARQKLSEAQGY
jgi:tetratricopeptide (TPR) repeat protein